MQAYIPPSSDRQFRLVRVWSIQKAEQLAWLMPFFLTKLPGSCIALEGECGAGKTAFVRALVHALDTRGGYPLRRVLSPSFAVHHTYGIRGEADTPIEHFDFYRLQGQAAELAPLDYGDVRERCMKLQGFVLIEWASRYADITLGLTHRLRIDLVPGGPEEARCFQLEALLPPKKGSQASPAPV